MTMQFLLHREGQPETPLEHASCAVPIPSATQVLVRVKAFGVNRADLLQKAGRYPPPSGTSPILGLEFCGEICQVGKQVNQWQLGQRVCAIVAGGAYAQYAVVEASHLIPVPRNLSDAEGAGLAEVFLTAYQALKRVANVNSKHRVLIHAGASGVGLGALQLCHFWKVESATTASSESKLARCQNAGASLLINYRNEDFVTTLLQHWPNGVDTVVDMVAGEYVNRNLKVLKLDGTIVCLAIMGGRFAKGLDMALLLGKRATLKGSTLRNRSNAYKADLVAAFVRDCLSGFTTGQLTVPIDTVYSVHDIDLAHRRMAANDTQGKLVIYWE